MDGMRDATGQMYMRNRYYDPATGQFTQQDPIGIVGGLNSYGFAAGDPVGNVDPFGTCAWGIGPDAAYDQCSATDTHHTRGLNQDPWAENSSCRRLGCALEDATPEQRDYVVNRLSTLRTDMDFCRRVSVGGLQMVARQFAIWKNTVRDEDGFTLHGNGPMNVRLGGPVMYLSAPLMRTNNGLPAVRTKPSMGSSIRDAVSSRRITVTTE